MPDAPLTQKRAVAIVGVEAAASADDRKRAYEEKRALLQRKLAEAPTPGLEERYRHSIELLTRAYETLEFAATEREMEKARREKKPARPGQDAGTGTAPAPERRSPRDFIVAQIIVLVLAVVLGLWRWNVSRKNAEIARVAAEAQAEIDRKLNEAKAAELARLQEAERQETLARAARAEAERRAAEERVLAQRNEEERLKNADRQTRVRLIELETQFEGLAQLEKSVDRIVADLKSAERDLAGTPGWLFEWVQRRRSLFESYRSWLGDFATRHPARVRMRAASQLLQAHDIDGAAGEARAGYEEWQRLAHEPERRRFADVGQVLVEWLIGPKEWPREVFDRARLDEPAAVATVVSAIKAELSYLNDPAKKPVFTDYRGRLLPLAWLAGETDRDYRRWRPRFIGTLTVSSTPSGAHLMDESGNERGLTPVQIELLRGTSVRLTANLQGFTPATVTASSGYEDNQELRIELSEISAPKAGQPYTVPELGLSLVWLNPGTFQLGSPRDEVGRASDEGPVKVSLTNGFWLGRYEVTQAEWTAVMKTNPSVFKRVDSTGGAAEVDSRSGNPVENVSWREAMEFCRRLTERERAAGRLPPDYEYTLPTEAQWEYACRAGSTTPFAGNLDDMGWYNGSKNGSTHPVGQKKPNAWGLHDMHGNVWEWCRDWHDQYVSERGTDTLVNPTGPTTGSYRINRGGSWKSPDLKCRSALRNWLTPNDRGNGLGFRLALSKYR